ncbi:MAG: oligosaccharide flippase family protein [Bacteroidota bacterium]
MKSWVQDIIQKIRESEFARHMLTVFSGTFAAQVFSIILLPFLAFYFDPVEFGLRGVFLAVQAAIAVALNGGYEMAIMLPKEEKDAQALLKLCLLLALGMSFLVCLFMILAGTFFWGLMNSSELIPWQYLLVGSLLMEGFNQPLRLYVNRMKQYRLLTFSKMAQPIIGGMAMLYLGWSGWGFEGLILGSVLGQASALLVLLVAISGESLEWFNLNGLRKQAQSYRDFPEKGLGAAFLHVFSARLPMYLFPAFFGENGKAVVGIFDMAQKALMMPFNMVSKAVGDVFYEQASRAKEKSQQALYRLTKQTFQYLALGGLLPSLLIVLFAPWVIPIFLKENWHATGPYIQWLMPWVYMSLMAIPLSFVMDVERRLGFQLGYQLVSFILRMAILFVGQYYLEPFPLIIAYSLLNAALAAYLSWMMLRMAGGQKEPSLPETS